MLYELRLYQPHAGRMPDLLRRFRDHIPALFARHGIECLGVWLTRGETQRLTYLTRYAGYAQREKAWAAFGADPQWHAVRQQGNAGSEMLQGYELHFLKPRPGMPMPARPDHKIRELFFLPTRHGQEALFSDWLRNALMPQLQAMGASLVHCFDVAAGAQLPQSLLMIGWAIEPTPSQRSALVGICLPTHPVLQVPALAAMRGVSLTDADRLASGFESR
jgi:hypothetical protein